MSDPTHTHPVDPERVAHARARLPSRDEAAQLTSVLSLMADPTRARVLFALDVVEEMCVGDLALALEANEDAVGYALRLLRTAGLVVNRKQGRVVYYRLANGFPEPLREHCLRQLIALTEAPSPTRTERKAWHRAEQQPQATPPAPVWRYGTRKARHPADSRFTSTDKT